jgi:hypothetical protein
VNSHGRDDFQSKISPNGQVSDKNLNAETRRMTYLRLPLGLGNAHRDVCMNCLEQSGVELWQRWRRGGGIAAARWREGWLLLTGISTTMNLWKMPSRQHHCRAFWIGLPLSSKAAWAHRFAKPRSDKNPICVVFSRAAEIQGKVEEPWIEAGEGSPEERHVAGRGRIGYPMGLGSLEKWKVVQGRGKLFGHAATMKSREI